MLFTPVIYQLQRYRSCSTSSLSLTDFGQTDSAHKKHAASTKTTTSTEAESAAIIIIVIIIFLFLLLLLQNAFHGKQHYVYRTL